MSWSSCWVPGCYNKNTETDIRKCGYFSLPLKDPESLLSGCSAIQNTRVGVSVLTIAQNLGLRLDIWLKNVGRTDIFDPVVHRHKKICGAHFESKMYCGCKLKRTAVPTVFADGCGYKANEVSLVGAEEPSEGAELQIETVQMEIEDNCVIYDNQTCESNGILKSILQSTTSPVVTEKTVQKLPAAVQLQNTVVGTSQQILSPVKDNIPRFSHVSVQTPAKLYNRTPRETKLLIKIEQLERKCLKLSKISEEPIITEESFLQFAEKRLGKQMANLIETQLKLETLFRENA